jgi:hypothetical protein
MFREGTNQLVGPLDVDALEHYVASAGMLVAPVADRVTRIAPR